jgi:hypothetical protein
MNRDPSRAANHFAASHRHCASKCRAPCTHSNTPLFHHSKFSYFPHPPGLSTFPGNAPVGVPFSITTWPFTIV